MLAALLPVLYLIFVVAILRVPDSYLVITTCIGWTVLFVAGRKALKR